MKTFEPNKNAKQLGIDITRKFVVVNSYGGNFNNGDILELVKDDNGCNPTFTEIGNLSKKEHYHWSALAYADENLIVRCPTQEKWNKVVQKALDSGKKWFSGNKDLFSDYWEKNQENSAICIKEYLEYACHSWLKKNLPYKDYTFLEAEKYLGEEKKEKPKFKVGDWEIQNKQFNQPKHKFMSLIKNLFKSKEDQAKEGLGLSDGNGGLNDYGRVEWADFLYKKLEKEREEFDALLVEKWEEGKKK